MPEWFHALLDFFLPCTRKEPHSRIYFSPSLFLGLEDFVRSDCDAPERSAAFCSPQTIRNHISFSWFVKPSKQLFGLLFPQPCGLSILARSRESKNLAPDPSPSNSCSRDDRPQRCCSVGHFLPLTERPGASHDTRSG